MPVELQALELEDNLKLNTAMESNLVLNALPKQEAGSGSARMIRRQGNIPAIVYGGKSQRMLALDGKQLLHVYNRGSLSALVQIALPEGEKIRAIIRDIQCDSITDNPIHIDFQEIIPGQPIKIAVPVRVLNEASCPGIKRGGVLNIVHRRIALYCDPEHIPSSIDIDISKMEIGQVVHIQDLQLSDKLIPVEKGNFSILSIGGRIEETEGKEEAAA